MSDSSGRCDKLFVFADELEDSAVKKKKKNVLVGFSTAYISVTFYRSSLCFPNYKSAQSVIGRLREIEKKPSPSENKWHHMRSHPPAAAENYRVATSGGVAKASQPADKQQAHQKMSFPGIIYF